MYHGTELAIAKKILTQGFSLSYAFDAEGDTEDGQEIMCQDGMYFAWSADEALWWAMVRMFEDGIGNATIPAVVEFDVNSYEDAYQVTLPVIDDPAPIDKGQAWDANIACFIGTCNGTPYTIRGVESVRDPHWGDIWVLPRRFFTLRYPTTAEERREAKHHYHEWQDGRESSYDGAATTPTTRRRRYIDRNL